jgi:glycogen phosphorylase
MARNHPLSVVPFTLAARSVVPSQRSAGTPGASLTEESADLERLRALGCEQLRVAGTPGSLYERHLIFDKAVAPAKASARDRFEAFAQAVRDVLNGRWVATRETYEQENPKQIYYLSMEFLIGRSLANNVTNLLVEDIARRAALEEGLDWLALIEEEPDAGLGNGGLGRLAACFLDSMATLQLPAMGYGLRYEYGMFKQVLHEGWQEEQPDNWQRRPDPWELARHDEAVSVQFGCHIAMRDGHLVLERDHGYTVIGIPYDRPVVSYGGETVNTLRLWSAVAPDVLDFQRFSRGDLVGATADRLAAESLTRVLYPDDSTAVGRELRFVQEYFLTACSLADLVRRFRRQGNPWQALPEKVAIQLNDTHPSLAVPELMRVLLDEAQLPWEEAWDLTRRTLGYTNHTLLPEALERWPVELFELLVPRLLEIVYEINRRFLDEVRGRYAGDEERVRRMSLIEEHPCRQVRMAHLAIVGSHSVNGVAAIHSQLLGTVTVRDFADMYPERFNNKTNGVTPRRWLRLANPPLAELITRAVGEQWVGDLSHLAALAPLASDAGFQADFLRAKRLAKVRLADWLQRSCGVAVDPSSIFDCQVKRIHEYKRQLLNVLRIVVLYQRLREHPDLDVAPRTFFFAGKAAPAYRNAKLIIKLVNNLAGTLDADPKVRGRLKVVFLPDYGVSLAERIIAAADVSNQISTAGFEASGTSNMKFMMNGALTLGTRDGATIEMAAAAGEENFFLFGLTAQQVADSRAWYDPRWHYEHEPETRAALDLLFSEHFSRYEPGVFDVLRDSLLNGDYYMHLADLRSYLEADAQLIERYSDADAWAAQAIRNVAASGSFSSDRTIAQYAAEIWGASACPVRRLVLERPAR